VHCQGVNGLPLLLEDLGVVMLKPENTSTNHRLELQFKKDFRVRRTVTRDWLDFLVLNHTGYHNILIDHDALSQLPEDDSAADRVMTANTERETDSPNLTRTTSAERAQPDNAELVEIFHWAIWVHLWRDYAQMMLG
jgi:hypothetical protein